MAIQEVKRKISFISFVGGKGRKKDESPSPTLTLNTKYGILTFSSGAMRELALDGKFIKFYFEPVRKIIGFQIKNQVNQSELKNGWKLVKAYAETGMWKVSVVKMLPEFNGRLTKVTYKDLPIKKYVEQLEILERGETYYFIQINDDPDELRKGVGNEELEEASAK